MSRVEDEEDDGVGFLEAFEEADRACDEYVRDYYDSLTLEDLGEGFFDQRLATIHRGVNIHPSRTFYTVPHRRERLPSDLPARHPLRAISWVLEQAPPGSTVRVYCYLLLCPMAIGLLIFHGGNKTVNIILHPSNQTIARLEEFFTNHGSVVRRAFRDRLHIRVANLHVTNCGQHTQMHDNSILTHQHTTFGSYNLTNAARYQNWESLYVADSEPSHVVHFDALWNRLNQRNIQTVNPTLAPPSPAVGRRRPRGGGDGGDRSNPRRRVEGSG